MSFCRDAALMSMRKVIKDKSPEEIKLLSKNDLEKPVTMDDFNEGSLLRGIVNAQRSRGTAQSVWTTLSIPIIPYINWNPFFTKTVCTHWLRLK